MTTINCFSCITLRPTSLLLNLLRSFISICISLFVLSCSVVNNIDIVSPAEGVYLSANSTEITVSFLGEPSELVVWLNGEDVTSDLIINDGLAQGQVTGLFQGLNVLRVTLGDQSSSRRFAYSEGGIPDIVTPILTEPAYYDLVQSRYDISAHNNIMTNALQRGFTRKIAIPIEIDVGDGSTTLIARLHNDSVPGEEEISVMSVKLIVPDFGEQVVTYLLIKIDECNTEVFDGQYSSIENTCALGNSEATEESGLVDTLPQTLHIVQGVSCTGNCNGSVAGVGRSAASNVFGCKNPIECITAGAGYVQSIFDLSECINKRLSGQPVECGGDDGSSSGDPHIITIDGLFYDNQLGGEFVFIREKGAGDFEVQTRQLQLGCVSINIGSAMRLNSNIVEYDFRTNALLVDGMPYSMNTNNSVTLNGGGILSKSATGIYGSDTRGNWVFIGGTNGGATVRVGLSSDMSGNVEGLLGDYNGSADDDTVLRSGQIANDLNYFNEDWRILNEESLFTYSDGESSDTYTAQNTCTLIPSRYNRDRATQIYTDQCGENGVPSSEESLVKAIALDIAAGWSEVEIIEWLNTTFCVGGNIIKTINAVWEGDNLGVIGSYIDSIEFGEGVQPPDINLDRVGENLIITVDNTGESFEATNYFIDTGFDDFNIVFNNGISWNQSDIKLFVLEGSPTQDYLVGYDTDDILDGGFGDDQLEGKEGNDTYIFDIGYGLDTIFDVSNIDGEIDRVVFGDAITPENVQIRRQNDDLVISILGTEDVLRVTYYFLNDNRKVESLDFSNGISFVDSDIRLLILEGTAGDDILISSNDGDDLLDGGFGDDQLEGKEGNDTYIFDIGYGLDTIFDVSNIDGEIDRVVFGDAITPENILLRRETNNLVISILGAEDKLTVSHYFLNDNSKVESLDFSNGISLVDSDIRLLILEGTAGDDILISSNDGDDLLDGGSGDDRLEGKEGNDTYIFDIGYGLDTIFDLSNIDGEIDRVVFGDDITPENILLRRENNDLVISILGTEDKLRASHYFLNDNSKVELLDFNNGISFVDSDIRLLILEGTAGDDVLISSNDGDDLLDGGAGDDRLEGKEGNDTYIFDIGYGLDTIFDSSTINGEIDRVVFGDSITPANVQLRRQSHDLVIFILGTEDMLRVSYYFLNDNSKVESLDFSNGISFVDSDIQLLVLE